MRKLTLNAVMGALNVYVFEFGHGDNKTDRACLVYACDNQDGELEIELPPQFGEMLFEPLPITGFVYDFNDVCIEVEYDSASFSDEMSTVLHHLELNNPDAYFYKTVSKGLLTVVPSGPDITFDKIGTRLKTLDDIDTFDHLFELFYGR